MWWSDAVRRYLGSMTSSDATEAQKEERNDSGSQDSATLNSTHIPTKRSASPLHTEDTALRKRTRAKICDDEKRLREHHSPNPHATPIPLPANEWKVSNPMSNTQSRRKPAAGGIKPTNTLNKSHQSRSTPRTLETATTTGDNVQGAYTSSPHFSHHDHPPKRRKLDTPSPSKARPDDNVKVVITKTDFLNREPLSQPGRKLSSTVTSDSQGSVRTTHRPEMDTLLGRQKKPRKANPKKFMGNSSSQMGNDREVIEVFDSQPSQTMKPPPVVPIAHSSRHNAIVVGDDDHVEHIRKKPVPSQAVPAELPRAPTIEIQGAFNHMLRDDALVSTSQPEQHAKQIARPNKSTNAPPIVRDPSPSLHNKFRRDNSPARPSVRKSMLPSSSVSNTALAEGSEDELAHGSSVARGSNPRRSISPSNIKSTTFTRTTPAKRARRKGTVQDSDQEEDERHETFKLAAFYTLSSEGSSSDDLTLTFYRNNKSFVIQKGGVPALASFGEGPYLISSNHAQKIWTIEDQLHVGIEGSKDTVTGGYVWFDFLKREDGARCLQLLNAITPDKVKINLLDPDQYGRRLDNSTKIFDKLRAKQPIHKDPELQAMEHRRESRVLPPPNKALAARERQKSAQKGNNPIWEEPRRTLNTAPTSLKDRMKSDSTVPDRRSEPKSSPATEALTSLQGRTTRTSRRLQDKDDAPIYREPRMTRWTREHERLEWDSPLVYPSTGPKRTTVEAQDIERLDDGEFLNDSLISFCLRHLEENNPGLKDKVHIFNTFFYTALSTKQGRRGFNYDAVKRWTKNIDIFTYPFVVVPVNVNLHWFVTIICNLDRVGRKLEDEDDSEDGNSMIDNQVGEDNVPGSLLRSELPDSQEEQNTEVVREEVGRLSISDSGKLPSDNDQDDEERIIYESDTPAPAPASLKARISPVPKAKRAPPPLPKLDSKQPIIITLDSLGASHSTEVRNLKNYIVQEGRDKREMTIEFSDIKGMLAKGIPEQTNFCDCGVYLVGYIAEFLKNPSEFVRKVLSRELDKNNDFAGFDPSEKRAEIRDQLIKLEKVQSEARRKQKKAQNDAKKQKAALRQVDGAMDDTESRATTPATRGSESGRQSKEVTSSPAAASVASEKTSVAGDENQPAGAGAEVVSDSFLKGIHEAAHG